nr:hypothetical protein [Lacticaseibacillus pantheris]
MAGSGTTYLVTQSRGDNHKLVFGSVREYTARADRHDALGTIGNQKLEELGGGRCAQRSPAQSDLVPIDVELVHVKLVGDRLKGTDDGVGVLLHEFKDVGGRDKGEQHPLRKLVTLVTEGVNYGVGVGVEVQQWQ